MVSSREVKGVDLHTMIKRVNSGSPSEAKIYIYVHVENAFRITIENGIAGGIADGIEYYRMPRYLSIYIYISQQKS